MNSSPRFQFLCMNVKCNPVREIVYIDKRNKMLVKTNGYQCKFVHNDLNQIT